MLSNIKSAAKGTIIYGFANVSVKLIGIVLIPIYTNYKYLSKADFGAMGVMDITYQLVIIIFSLSLYQSLARWYFDPEHRSSQKSMHFTVISINAVICLISFLFVYRFAPQISKLLLHSEKYAYLVWIMFAGSSVNIVANVSLSLLRLQEKAIKYSVIYISKLIVTLSMTILFVVHMHRSVTGIYEAILVGEIVGFILIFSDIIRNSEIRFEGKKLLQMLQYGLPLMLASISTVLLNTFDRFSLNYMASLDAVGTYTLAFRFANTIKIIVITSIQLSLVPLMFKKMNDPDHKRFYAKSLKYSVFIVMLCVMFLSLFSLEIIKVFASNKSYWEAANILPILSFSMVFVLMKENVLIGLQITKSSAIMGTLIAITAAFNLGMNILLIPHYGIYGSAMSTLISQVVMFFLFYFVSQKKYPIPYEVRNIVLMIVTGLLVSLVAQLVNPLPAFIRILIKGILFISYPFILFPVKFYEPVELDIIRGFVLKYKNQALRYLHRQER
jgi:O-antigen/teichoic acid export membrane protein